MIKHIVIACTAFLSMHLSAREHINFNENWKFKLGDETLASTVNYKDSEWRVLNVPHDWSIEGDYNENNLMADRGGYLPAGIGWYRKTIEVPSAWKGKHVEIAFDGVYMNSMVYANGKKLGNRPYGWISFSYDISEAVLSSDQITFAVRVDNSKQPSARWYTGSGIYANTWIDVKEKVHIPVSGVFVKTKGNSVSVETDMVNETNKDANISVISSIQDAKGKVLVSTSEKIKLPSSPSGEHKSLSASLVLPHPKRWDIDSPYLYTLVSELKSGKKVLDKVETRFGVRDVEWVPETGMWINGKNIKLQGICNHADAGALGVAVPDKIMRFRIQQLKDMGVNAIRTSHYPRPPQFYDMCDEMGMLVMDEVFDGWHKKAEYDYGARYFDAWWYRDLSDWVKRDRNHPSVVMYSVGNETKGEIGKDLVARCHELDATRPVTSGHSASEYMDILGVNGSSEKMGWFDELEKDRVFVGTENTHTWQVRGYYRTKTWYRDGYPSKRQKPYWYPDLTEEEVFSYDWIDPKKRKNFKQIFNSSYDNAMVRLNVRQNIEQVRDIPNYAGSFRWTGHDYIGEAGYVHGGWPFKAFMGGAIDMANFEKDLYYLYQSQWTQKPMVHILPHWTHPTLKEGTEIPVWIYSNCDEVELLFNGKSLGKMRPGRKWNEMQCQYMLGYKPGTLKAVGYNDGKAVAEKTIRTAGAPAKIALSVDGEPLAQTGVDLVQVRVSTTDLKGEFYPYGENRTYFHVVGDGKIRALDNGSPVDVEKHFEAKDRIAFYGLTRAYVESTGDGDVALIAACILGEKKQVTSNKVSIDVKELALRGAVPEGKIEIFYTLDNSRPTTASTPYTSPFEVELGTTVKALVLFKGKALFIMKERFAKDEGFVWDAVAQAAKPGGDQAEDASYKIANFSNEGANFNGQGYLDMGRNPGSWVEWYQENDGSPGKFELKIRYSASDFRKKQHKIKLTVNGKDQELVLTGHKNATKEWHLVETSANLESGANTIRLTLVEGEGVYIDELRVK